MSRKADLCACLCLRLRRRMTGTDRERWPMQRGGTSFISAHLLRSHSSLTPLTDELLRLVKLPADSALAQQPPSASSSLSLCRYLVPTLLLHLASGGGRGGRGGELRGAVRRLSPKVTGRTALRVQADVNRHTG